MENPIKMGGTTIFGNIQYKKYGSEGDFGFGDFVILSGTWWLMFFDVVFWKHFPNHDTI